MCILNIGLMKSGTAAWQEAEVTRKDFNTVLTPSGQEILYFRGLQGHSGRSPIDPSLQDNVLIPNNFFEYNYHIGCAINLHSIMNSRLIPGGQNLSKSQTVFFLPINPLNKNQQSGRNIKILCIGSTSILLRRKDLSSIKLDRTPSSFTIHSQPIVSRRLS